MVGSDYRQESTQSRESDNLLHLIPIDFTDDTGHEFGMPIRFEQIEAGEYLTELIGTSNTFIPDRVKRVETDRKRYSQLIELLYRTWGQSGSICNEGEVKSNLNQILKDWH
jgi:hypothetical protein